MRRCIRASNVQRTNTMLNVQLSILLVLFATMYLIFAESSEENRERCEKECKDTQYTPFVNCLVCCRKTCNATTSSSRTECKDVCVQNIPENYRKKPEEKDRESTVSDGQNITVTNSHNTVNTTTGTAGPNDEITHTNCTTQNETLRKVEMEPCCQVISPRQCVPIPFYPFFRCFHYRDHICGPYCKAPIVHKQHNQNCQEAPNGGGCQKIVMYIPQPTPRCAYQPFWPYVVCGIQQEFCGGCYAHYNLPFKPLSCPFSCYDDGYGAGPLYRQGPFYRPGFAHIPSCFQVGTCNFGNDIGNGVAVPPLFKGCGYPPVTYDDDVPVEPDVEEIEDDFSGKENKSNETNSKQIDEVPRKPRDNVISGWGPSISTNFPRGVNFEFVFTQPEKNSRYAEITINNMARNTTQEEYDVGAKSKSVDNEIQLISD